MADLLRSVLPGMDALKVGREAAVLDAQPWREVETALADAARLPPDAIASLRESSVAPQGVLFWPRVLIQPWCRLCVAEAFARCGEFYRRAEWTSGAYVVCPKHQAVLSCACPLGGNRCGPKPVLGRLRLWCGQCDRCVDDARDPRTSRRPPWLFAAPAGARCCPSVVLKREAWRLILQAQSALVGAMSGIRGHSHAELWVRTLRPDRLLDAMRALVFLLLGPLWEDGLSAAEASHHNVLPRAMTASWSPGLERPEVVAATFAVTVAVLTSLIDQRPRTEVAWTPALLRKGERETVDVETLCWHLTSHDLTLLERFLPDLTPFCPRAFHAVFNDLEGRRGPNREEARRRAGFGGAERCRRARAQRRKGVSAQQAAESRRRQSLHHQSSLPFLKEQS